MNGIYRILTDQRLEPNFKRKKITGYFHTNDLDISNKQASIDAMSFAELSICRTRNRHRIYRKKTCGFCGNDLQHENNKTGKEKFYCGMDCNQLYRLFVKRLDLILASDESPRRLKIFAEYCLIQMIFRVPATRLNEQLKKASRKKQIVSITVR